MDSSTKKTLNTKLKTKLPLDTRLKEILENNRVYPPSVPNQHQSAYNQNQSAYNQTPYVSNKYPSSINQNQSALNQNQSTLNQNQSTINQNQSVINHYPSCINQTPSEPSQQEPESSKNEIRKRIIEEEITSFSNFFKEFHTSFWAARTHNSTSLDVIAVYLKGQKIIYIESKNFCERTLYQLMLPAIAVSSICTVLSIATNSFSYGSILVSSLTAFNSFLLAIISYLKLDAKAESYRVSAYKFDKLQTKCEFFSGKILYSNMKEEDIVKEVTIFIDQLEKDIEEIKEVNQFVIPQSIRYRYPKLYSTNVFAEIKKKGNTSRLYTHDLHTVYNKIGLILDDINNLNKTDPDYKESLKKNNEEIKRLNITKEKLISNIIEHHNTFNSIDEDMNKEISRYITKYNYGCFYYLCGIRRKKETNEKQLIEERRKIRQLVIQDALAPEFKNDDEDSIV
jgi:hypothetical protein